MHGGEQEAGVRVHQVQEAVENLLGAGEQAAQVVVLLVLEDAGDAGLRQHADDLVVDVDQLVPQLLL